MDAFDLGGLRDTLLSIDEEASLIFGSMESRMDVVIVGGGAFILREVTTRPVTHDVDILDADMRLREILDGYPALNSRVAAFSDLIPYGYEERLEEVSLPTRAVRFLTPSLEDLAVMKLYSWRPNDEADLTNEALLSRLDWDKLETLVYGRDEARASCLSQRRFNEMTDEFERYKRKYRKGD